MISGHGLIAMEEKGPRLKIEEQRSNTLMENCYTKISHYKCDQGIPGLVYITFRLPMHTFSIKEIR